MGNSPKKEIPNKTKAKASRKAKETRNAGGKGGGRISHTTEATKSGERMKSEPPLSHQRRYMNEERLGTLTEERPNL